jgi:hypothetical protein
MMGGHARPLWQEHRSNILATLAKSELFNYAIERWAQLSSDYEESGEDECADSDGDAVLGKEKHDLDNIVTSSLEDIEVIVSSMFAVIPALRSLRRSYILDLEAAGLEATSTEVAGLTTGEITLPNLTAGNPSLHSIVKSEADSKTHLEAPKDIEKQPKPTYTLRVVSNEVPQDAVFDETIRLVKELEEALRNDEDLAKAYARDITAFSVDLHEQRVQLDRYYRSYRTREKGVSSTKADLVVQLNKDVKQTMNAVMPFENTTQAQLMSSEEMDSMVNNLIKQVGKANSILAA